MTEYPMTEEEFIKRITELFMGEFKQIPDKDKEEYLKSDDVQEFMRELYIGTCNKYDIKGLTDAFSDEMLSQYPVYNLQVYF